MDVKLRNRQSCDMDRADLGNGDVDLPGPVHLHIGLKVDLSPNTEAEFVARADDVIRWNWRQIQRRKRRGHIPKEIGSKNRENLASRRRCKLLEFGQWFGR